MSELVLLGDEAVALGALHAGLSGAYGYPGTPSSEILEYLGLSSIFFSFFIILSYMTDSVMRINYYRFVKGKKEERI